MDVREREMPKLPQKGFIIFILQVIKPDHPGCNMGQLNKIGKIPWSKANKEHYYELERQDILRYDREMKEYQAPAEIATPVSSATESAANLTSSSSATISSGNEAEAIKFWPLVSPANEEKLSEHFGREDLWDFLAKKRGIQSNMDGGQKEEWKLFKDYPVSEQWFSWVKGYEMRLPFGALMTLADGRWVEGCLIDVFLEQICHTQNVVKFFSHGQILHYSTHYEVACNWRIAETRIILAPLYVRPDL